LISVLMTVFNSEKYLREAIESILEQSYTDFEFIIVSDVGCNDETKRIVRGYKDRRIVFIENIVRKGIAASSNIGVKAARGRYIARIDSDDVAHKDRLSHQYRYLEEHTDIAAVGCNFIVIDKEGRELYKVRQPKTPLANEWVSMFYPPIAHPTAMIRRDVIESVGGYNENVPVSIDYEIWNRIMEGHSVTNDPRFLMRYRIHGKGVSEVGRDLVHEISADISTKRARSVLGLEIDRDFFKVILDPSRDNASVDLDTASGALIELYDRFVTGRSRFVLSDAYITRFTVNLILRMSWYGRKKDCGCGFVLKAPKPGIFFLIGHPFSVLVVGVMGLSKIGHA